jgi:O-antigen/teichoic acid export membrane protein
MSEGVFVASASVLVLAYHRIDYLIVYRLEPAATAGRYAAASRLLSQGLLLPAIVVTVLVPRLARQIGSGENEALWLRRCLQLAAVSGVIVMIALLVLSRPLVVLAFGPQFARASGLVTGLAVSMPFMSVGLMALEAHILLKRVRSQLILAGAILVLNLLTTIGGLEALGVNGAVIATDVTEAAAALVFAISAVRSARVPSGRSSARTR